jgi:hypothetical protein
MRREHPLTFSLCDVFGNGAAHNTGGIQELREQLKLDPGGGTCLSSTMWFTRRLANGHHVSHSEHY